MRLMISGLLCLVLSFGLNAQSFFKPAIESNVPEALKSGDRGIVPLQYFNFSSDHAALTSFLEKELPLENVGASVTIEFPVSSSRLQTFTITRKSNFHPTLAAKYPQIGSYQGVSLDGKSRLSFSSSPWNFFAEIKHEGEVKHLQPYAANNYDHLIFYDKVDYLEADGVDFHCGLEHTKIHSHDDPAQELQQTIATYREKAGEPVVLRTYRIAVAAVAEFTNVNNGVSGSLAKINEALNLLNGIYNREVAVQFELIADNDQLIYTDASTDPYLSVSDGAGLLAQNQTNLDATIGNSAYDIGHVFTRSCSNGLGGIAALASVCGANKGRGVTCHFSSNIATMVNSVMAHEVGHSFSSPHIWNRCPDSQDQFAPNNAYTPGSGTTIMSYAGACGSDNVLTDNDDYFHVGSLNFMYDYRDSDGACGSTSDANSAPDINIISQGGVTIPMMTPFKLDASATDMEGHGLTYCWEQYDLGPTAPLGSPIGDGPAFRSFPPTDATSRVFPRWSNILTGTSSNSEVLATYTREYNFRVTVRDDYLPAGGVAWEQISFSCTEDAGAFKVTGPTAAAMWEEGTVQSVTWDVSNTDQMPVNCQAVNIWLSTSGANFDTPLAMNVPNSGSADVLVPALGNAGARILVEAADNLFFNVNSGTFNVSPASGPGLALDFLNVAEQVCLPGNIELPIGSSAIQGYANMVTYDVTGLPSGATATFSANPVMPGTAVTLTLDFADSTPNGNYNLELTASGDGITTISRPFTVNALSQDFSALTLTTPANEATGIAESPTLDWSMLPNANSYDVQVSNNPAFDPANTFEGTGVTQNNFTPSQPLMKNTLYYWRVKAANICSDGEWSEIFVFHTINFACIPFDNSDLNFSIPTSEGTVTNVFNIAQTGTINDLDVTNIDIDYQAMNFMKIELESPSGTKEVLYDKDCSGSKLNIGFNDQAPLAIACPPTDAGLYMPVGSLSSFDGESTQGDWKLSMTTSFAAFDPGKLNSWELQVCSNFTPQAPILVENNTLPVKTGDAQWFENTLLRCTDADNTASELVYTLVTVPEFGVIDLDGTDLTVGGTFTQTNINAVSVKYSHTGSTEVDDSFIFTVTDGAGGFVGPTVFNISVDDDNPVLSTLEKLSLTSFELYPNPTSDELWINSEDFTVERVLNVVDVQGRILSEHVWNSEKSMMIPTDQLTNGVYYLRIQEENKVGTMKFTVLR